MPIQSVGEQPLESFELQPPGGVSNSVYRGSEPELSQETSTISQNENHEDHDFPDGGTKAYSVVFGSFMGLVSTFGLLNSMGAIQAYVSIHQLSHVSTSTISWIFSIYLALSFAVGVVVGPVFDRIGSRLLLLGGSCLSFAGLMSTASCTQVWQFILALSICVGLGNALMVTPLVGVIGQWFCRKRGVAIGMATTGGSVGGIAIPLMLRSLYTLVGFTWAIRVLAFFCLGCQLCAALLATSRDAIYHSVDNDGKKQKFIDFRHLLDRKLSFLIAGTFVVELALMSATTYFASYAIKQGISQSSSYLLLTIFNASGVLGRWIPGYISDFYGRFNVMVVMLIGFALSILVIWLPFGQYHGAIYAFAVAGGFTSASILTMTPVCLGEITPTNEFGQRYGLLYIIVSVGNLFGIPMSAAIIGDESEKNYRMFVLFCGLLSFMGAVCWFISRYYIVGLKLNVRV